MERERIEWSSTAQAGRRNADAETAKNGCNLIRQEHHFLEGAMPAGFLSTGAGFPLGPPETGKARSVLTKNQLRCSIGG